MASTIYYLKLYRNNEEIGTLHTSISLDHVTFLYEMYNGLMGNKPTVIDGRIEGYGIKNEGCFYVVIDTD